MYETEMLPSCENCETMKKRILSAARKYFHKRAGITAFFEHGHWWLRVGCRTYDVVDAGGGDSINGFDFEEIE